MVEWLKKPICALRGAGGRKLRNQKNPVNPVNPVREIFFAFGTLPYALCPKPCAFNHLDITTES
jgi:hypothetical protein